MLWNNNEQRIIMFESDSPRKERKEHLTFYSRGGSRKKGSKFRWPTK